MNAHQIIILARKHVMQGGAPMQFSAELCLSDAIAQHNKGALDRAKERAVKSLAYAVGIGHPDYKRAAR
jgi:hypothetical protein